MDKEIRCIDLLAETFGEQAIPMAEELLDTTYEVMELEAMHFFQEGYKMGRRERHG